MPASPRQDHLTTRSGLCYAVVDWPYRASVGNTSCSRALQFAQSGREELRVCPDFLATGRQIE